jgi:superfamily I DNA and RNA helicase
MVTIINGTTNKPAASEQLKDFFRENTDFNGTLYFGYPIIASSEGAYPIDALWISKEKGLVVFNIIEGKDCSGYEDSQDDSYVKVEARLKSHKELVNRRKLQVAINVITYAPEILNLPKEDDYPICGKEGLYGFLDKITWDNPEYYDKAVSVLQSISMLRRGKRKRVAENPDSKAAKLQRLEDAIATLDNEQGRAVIETAEGVQRIRGLAGSGKTIVLALKAAYLHAQHPDWKIAVTFYTQALKGQMHRLITTFYMEQTNQAEPDWDNLHIVHAWGSGAGNQGVYYDFCLSNGVEYYDYQKAKNRFGRENAFAGSCESALSEAEETKQKYDAILVDEAQDLPVSFLRICYEMLREPKRLVYAYDELQSLNSMSLPAPEKLFGNDVDGRPRVKFKYDKDGSSNQDIVLKRCYRNSRPALVTAHALGFGIYRRNAGGESGLVQMFEDKNLWTDIGYEVVGGTLREGSRVVLARSSESSPEFLEKHSDVDDLICFKSFKSVQDQNEWIAGQVMRNLKDDGLNLDDIIVINPDPLKTLGAVAPIREILFDNKIMSHVAGVGNSPDTFMRDDSVVFTGIYRAKGNEAAMVYVINADDCVEGDGASYTSSGLARLRNRLFTAITRSKAWVRVVGVGPKMESLIKEYDEVKKRDYTLDFVYPTEAQRKSLNIINRDKSEAQIRTIRRQNENLSDVVRAYEDGNLYMEDIEPELRKKLTEIFGAGYANEIG